MGLGIDLYGKERRIIRMISRMKRIAPLFMISSWDKGDVTAELSKHGLCWRKASFGYLGLARWKWTLINISRMPALFAKLIMAKRVHRPQVLLFAEVLSFLNAFPVFLCWKVFRKIRIVFYLGDITAGSRLQRWLLVLADWCADLFVVNSQAVREGIRQAGVVRTPIHVVYNGLDADEFEHQQCEARSDIVEWAKRNIVFGYVGQLKEKKGVSDFLEAARLLASNRSNVRFLVVGECPQQTDYPEQLKQQFADLESQVRFAGFVRNLPSYYRLMDVLVVPSRHVDPAPNVNLEAMACSLPIIATRMGGNVELVEDNISGFLVAPADPRQLAQAMQALADDPDLRKAMGREGKERCLRLFDLNQNAQRIESLILGDLQESGQVQTGLWTRQSTT